MYFLYKLIHNLLHNNIKLIFVLAGGGLVLLRFHRQENFKDVNLYHTLLSTPIKCRKMDMFAVNKIAGCIISFLNSDERNILRYECSPEAVGRKGHIEDGKEYREKLFDIVYKRYNTHHNFEWLDNEKVEYTNLFGAVSEVNYCYHKSNKENLELIKEYERYKNSTL